MNDRATVRARHARGPMLPAFGMLLACLVSSFLSGCEQGGRATGEVSMDQVRADLLTVSQSRVFFGHHSVGNNIIKGVQALAAKTGVTLRVEEIQSAPPPDGPGLFHGKVGENLAPDSKIQDFAARLESPTERPFDVAVFKFCYVDLDEDSRERSPSKLFERYRKTLAEVQAKHPDVTILHGTMPLMSDPPGRKTRLKRLLGIATWTDEGNIRRNAYNAFVRQQFGSAELLDVARFEATRLDGSIAGFSVDGRQIETLAGEYTNDGGHLNELGQQHVAAAFLHTLAEAIRKRHAPVAER